MIRGIGWRRNLIGLEAPKGRNASIGGRSMALILRQSTDPKLTVTTLMKRALPPPSERNPYT